MSLIYTKETRPHARSYRWIIWAWNLLKTFKFMHHAISVMPTYNHAVPQLRFCQLLVCRLFLLISNLERLLGSEWYGILANEGILKEKTTQKGSCFDFCVTCGIKDVGFGCGKALSSLMCGLAPFPISNDALLHPRNSLCVFKTSLGDLWVSHDA